MDEPGRQWRRSHKLVRVLQHRDQPERALIVGPDSVISMQLTCKAEPFIALPRYETETDKPRIALRDILSGYLDPCTQRKGRDRQTCEGLLVPDRRRPEVNVPSLAR